MPGITKLQPLVKLVLEEEDGYQLIWLGVGPNERGSAEVGLIVKLEKTETIVQNMNEREYI